MANEKTYQGQIITNGYLAGLDNPQSQVTVEQEVNKVDVVVRNQYGIPHILIEFKHIILNDDERRRALAQIVITCKKNNIFGAFYAIAYRNSNRDDVFEYFQHNDYYFNNNAVNWENETPSNPSPDAIIAINNSLTAIQTVKGVQIRQRILDLIENITEYEIHRNNCIKIFNDWISTVQFDKLPRTEANTDTIINLFITDLLNSTDEYEDKFLQDESARFNIRDNLFFEKNGTNCYELLDPQKHKDFWTIYKRPPIESEFRFIIEKRNEFFDKQYRSIVGGEYTPSILTQLQLQILNEKLGEHWRDEYIVFDPCCGVGNLQDILGNDYKKFCFLSTLDAGDVSVCQAKGYASSVQFDFLKNKRQQELLKSTHQSDIPVYDMHGEKGDINFFAKKLNRKVLVLVNPPYNGKIAGSIHGDLFVDFIDKITGVVKNCTMFAYCPDAVYTRKEYFDVLQKKKGEILFAGLANAHDTFGLKNWGIAISLWKFGSKKELSPVVKMRRYEVSRDKSQMKYVSEVIYDSSRTSFTDYIKKHIGNNSAGTILGEFYSVGIPYFCNPTERITGKNKIATGNLEDVLLQSGVLYNSDLKYYEYYRTLAKAPDGKIKEQLKSDLITLALFYKTNATGKDSKSGEHINYFVPFTEKELGFPSGKLAIAFPPKGSDEEPFDFRIWYNQYKRSAEAEALYRAALKIYRFYHQRFSGRTNPNDGWNVIKLALCQDTLDTKIKLAGNYSVTQGSNSRKGEDSYWNPKKLDSKYGVLLFSDYDRALLGLMQRVQDELVAAGIYLFKPSCLR
jgi:hypothetical protein